MQDILRRARSLLTRTARPPFRLAGIELFDRLSDLVTCLDTLIAHQAEPRFVRLRHEIDQALDAVRPAARELHQAAEWLHGIAALLDPAGKPPRAGDTVRLPQAGGATSTASKPKAAPRRTWRPSARRCGPSRGVTTPACSIPTTCPAYPGRTTGAKASSVT